MKLTRQSIDWPAFHSNSNVRAMTALTKGIYLLLLGELWANGGWLLDDDRHIARRLGLDLRTWRKHRAFIEPELEHVCVTGVGNTIQQARLSREYAHTLEMVDKKRAQTEPARAKRLAKSKHAPSVTESQSERQTETVTEPVTTPETMPAAATVTDGEAEAEKKEALLPNSRELLSSAPAVDDTALPPRANGHAEGSAGTGSPGLEDRSPPQPSEKAEKPVPPNEPAPASRHEPVIEPSPALLRTPLVKRATTGFMAVMPKEDDDDEDR